jgi:DNA-binding NtrC family response regulator
MSTLVPDQPPIRLLIVEDQRSISHLCAIVGRGLGLVCFEAESAGQALERMENEPTELVLAGLAPGAGSGVELLGELKRRWPQTVVTLMSAEEDMESALAAMRLGAYEVVVKSFRVERLQWVMERMVERVRLQRENESLRSRLQGRLQGAAAATAVCTDLEELERLTVERVFAEVGGNKEQAQQLLGISRATLYRKLKRYGIKMRPAPKKTPEKQIRAPEKRVVVWSQG